MKNSQYELLEKTLHEIADLNKKIPIIVEGEKDKAALRQIGMAGEIIVINCGFSIEILCEVVSRKYNEVIILTDWDKKGGVLARKLKDLLTANGTKYNDVLRARIASSCKKEIKDVESLPALLERHRRQQQI